MALRPKSAAPCHFTKFNSAKWKVLQVLLLHALSISTNFRHTRATSPMQWPSTAAARKLQAFSISELFPKGLRLRRSSLIKMNWKQVSPTSGTRRGRELFSLEAHVRITAWVRQLPWTSRSPRGNLRALSAMLLTVHILCDQQYLQS